MRFPVRWAAVGTAGLILGLWALVAPLGHTSDSDEKDIKEMRDSVVKLAGSIEKKEQDQTKKQAAEIAKKFQGKKPAVAMEDLMHLFVLRSRKGLGVGAKAGAVMPDGIEKKVEELADKAPSAKQLGEDAAGLEQMAYSMAAIAEVSRALAPEKDMGKKKIKDWVKWSEDMRDASLALAEAAKKKDASGVKSAADKANTSCNKCHDVFRFDN